MFIEAFGMHHHSWVESDSQESGIVIFCILCLLLVVASQLMNAELHIVSNIENYFMTSRINRGCQEGKKLLMLKSHIIYALFEFEEKMKRKKEEDKNTFSFLLFDWREKWEKRKCNDIEITFLIIVIYGTRKVHEDKNVNIYNKFICSIFFPH